MASRPTLDFLKTEAGAGAFLGVAALLALLWANSPWAARYFAFINADLTIHIGAFDHTKSVLKWTKDGLMAVFFFVVGLEIKYEILTGELSNPRKLALPVLAAVGGMVAPALVYLAFNLGPNGQPGGWPTPAATDIAFALAALAAIGPRLPASLRVFLLTLAIADDLGAVALIAVLFTAKVQVWALAAAGGVLAAMALTSFWRSAPLFLYAVGFAAVWALALESGVNTSLAGVAAALTVPIAAPRPGRESALKRAMSGLHPYVAYGILPFFAFVAAGFSFKGLSLGQLFAPVPLGIMAGLLIGKQVGVLALSALAVGLGLARRPSGATWLDLYGAALLCGVGFTMSLFIGALAFDPRDPLIQTQVRLGVIAGSAASALAGMAVLAWSARRRPVEA